MSTETESIIRETRQQMDKSVEHTNQQFSTLHTGKASPAMVDSVHVAPEAYGGGSMSLSNVAAITTPDSRTIQIQPWDKSIIKDIEKAIIKANIGLNPSIDGGIVRINVPELSKERRLELGKVAHGMAEEGRIAIRHARREALDKLKALQKDGHVSEDEIKREEKQVQEMTDEHVKKIDEHLAHKEKELLQV